MIRNVDAIYDHGVLRPVEPLALPEGALVHLRVEEAPRAKGASAASGAGELPTLLERMKDFVGTVPSLPSDASVNLDHYLYGTSKRE